MTNAKPEEKNNEISGDLKNVYNSVVTLDNITVHQFFITGEIEINEPWYSHLIKTLSKPEAGRERIEIYMNTCGGNMSAMQQIVSAVDRSKLEIHLYIEGVCMSAGTFITFIPKGYSTITISPHTTFLFHMGSMFSWQKLNDLKDQVNYYTDYAEELLRTYFGKVLTNKEIDQVVKGKELYLSGNEVRKRIMQSRDAEALTQYC